MKKIRFSAILLFIAVLLFLPFFTASRSTALSERGPAPAWTQETLVAHAMGSIDEHPITNSKEAFLANYDKGYRLFEVDLQLTTDGYLISRHDWDSYLYDQFEQKLPRDQMDRPLSRDSILNLPILDSYHAMSFDQIVKLMSQHPDVWIITDTKGTTADEVKAAFQSLLAAAGDHPAVLDRIIPQIYSEEMYGWIDQLHSFSSYIYTLYQSQDSEAQILDFVQHNEDIDAITMPADRALNSIKFINELHAFQVPVYAHTVNEAPIAKSLLALGVHGFYTDFLTHDTIHPSKN